MTYTFTFTDRATWLAFRAEWRIKYKAISEEIRDLKRQITGMRGRDTSREQSRLHYARIRANELMKELQAAKEFKAQQFAARAALAA